MSGIVDILSFNIWEDGRAGINGIIETVQGFLKRGSTCSIVGLQEVSLESFDKIVSTVGLDLKSNACWSPCRSDVRGTDKGMGILSTGTLVAKYASRLPANNGMLELDGHGAKVEIAPGLYLRVFNCHLHYRPYGPYVIKEAADRLHEQRKASAVTSEGATNETPAPVTQAVSATVFAEVASAAVRETDAAQGEDLQLIYRHLIQREEHEPGLPAVLLGDFNAPSHRDWLARGHSQQADQEDAVVMTIVGQEGVRDTEAAATAVEHSQLPLGTQHAILAPPDAVLPLDKTPTPMHRVSDEHFSPHVRLTVRWPVEVRWPTSLFLEQHGFVDAFRHVHPDPDAHPGVTWPAMSEQLMGFPATVYDRIDFIYVRGAANSPMGTQGQGQAPDERKESAQGASRVQVLQSTVLTSTGVAGAPWPSDHFALSARLALSPVTAPRYAVN